MSILRVEKNKNYTVMNRTALNDVRMSWKAKGIIAYMLSMPDDWTFYIEELVTHSTDGEASFRSGLKELKDHGYVKRFPIREMNKIISWETVIYEVPQLDNSLLGDFQHVEKQDVEKLHVGIVDVENQRLLSTDSLPSTEIKLNTEITKDIVDYLNLKTSSSYRAASKKTKELIQARWKEKFTVDDFKKVIDIKTAEWLHDPKMNKFLRPETLFGTKFESYLNQKGGVNDARSKSNYEGYDFGKERELDF